MISCFSNIFGSHHQRIFLSAPHAPGSNPAPSVGGAAPGLWGLPSNFPITRSVTGIASSDSALGKLAIPLIPSAVGADIAIEMGRLGIEYIPPAMGKVWEATRWSIKKLLSGAGTIFEKTGNYLKDSLLDGTLHPIARTVRNSAYSTLNWAAHVPGDLLSVPGAIGNGLIGVGSKGLSIPLKLLGAPLKMLGFGKVSEFADHMSQSGTKSLKKVGKPFENTLGTIMDLARTGKDNLLAAARGHTSAPIGVVSDRMGNEVKGFWTKVANNPGIFETMFKTRECMHTDMSGSLRPAEFQGGGHAEPAADHGGGHEEEHGGGEDHGGGHK